MGSWCWYPYLRVMGLKDELWGRAIYLFTHPSLWVVYNNLRRVRSLDCHAPFSDFQYNYHIFRSSYKTHNLKHLKSFCSLDSWQLCIISIAFNWFVCVTNSSRYFGNDQERTCFWVHSLHRLAENVCRQNIQYLRQVIRKLTRVARRNLRSKICIRPSAHKYR